MAHKSPSQTSQQGLVNQYNLNQ